MNLNIEQYTRIDSPLKRWDARWKLVSIAVFIFAVTTVQSPWTALIALCFALLALSAGRLPFSVVARRLGEIHLLLIPCFFILPFTVGGETFTMFGFSPSREGFELATILYLRAVAIVTASMAALFSTPMTRLLHAAEKLRAPRILIQIALLTYRYVFSLYDEFNTVRWALVTRGFRNRTSRRAYRILANVVGMSLVRSLERTDRIYRAMQCRGYTGNLRTLERFETRSSDLGKSLLCILASLALLWMDWNWACRL